MAFVQTAASCQEDHKIKLGGNANRLLVAALTFGPPIVTPPKKISFERIRNEHKRADHLGGHPEL
jgi:hypothetical protein